MSLKSYCWCIFFLYTLLDVELKQPLIWDTSAADTAPITLQGLQGLGSRNSHSFGSLITYVIPGFVFTSFISPAVNKCREAFLYQEIAVKNIFIVRSEKEKSRIHSSPLDVCPGSVLHLPLGFHAITRFSSESSIMSLPFSKSPRNSKFDIRSSSQAKHFHVKAERKGNLSRGMRKWEPTRLDLNKTEFTARLGLFFPPSPSPSTPTDPAVPL